MSNNLPIIRFVFDRRKKATVSKNPKTSCSTFLKGNAILLQLLTQNKM